MQRRHAFVIVVILIIAGSWAKADALAVLHETTKLTPTDGSSLSMAGFSSSIDGNIAVAGAAYASPNDTGAVYVFERAVGGWSQTATLLPSGTNTGKYFGHDVSVSGSTILVGAMFDQSMTSGGAAYIFDRQTDGTWTQTTRLAPSDLSDYDRFGWSVAIDGSYAIVGANYGSGFYPDSGAAYMYAKSGGTWNQVAKLTPPGSANMTLFGQSVAISGNLAVVGAPETSRGTIGGYGAAYVYELNTTTGKWNYIKRLDMPFPATGSSTNENFGETVAISNDTIIVAAPGDRSGGTDKGWGSVTIFERDIGGHNAWGVAGYFYRPSDIMGPFISDVAIDGDYAIAGGVLFHRDATVLSGWSIIATLNPTDTTLTIEGHNENPRYADSVAISGETIITGAIFLDGNQIDTGGLLVFTIPEPTALGLITLATPVLFLRRRR